MAQYVYESFTRILRDAPLNSDFHIRSGDFFSYLATIMSGFEESLASCTCECGKESQARDQKLARELRHMLRYLQAHYTVEPRPIENTQEVQPSGNLISRYRENLG